MTDAAATAPEPQSREISFASLLFGLVVFVSAALVFMVEPMVAKLLLPKQGGSPMVWNTCMAFFQMALLVGYGYAHLLQRVRAVKTQAVIHAGVLLAAALALPLRVTSLLGEPGSLPPALWLVGVLAVSLGLPFAALSATAPLAQAWYARVRAGHADAQNPYVLYVASNLGSLIALLAYPVIVEPTLTLSTQTLSWTVGYGFFVLLMAGAAFAASKRTGAAAAPEAREAPPAIITWKDRLIWIGLAAAPSSLMLGVTTHVTTDVASAPFLWVAPLALYLITFIIAFQSRPVVPYWIALTCQALFAAAMADTFNLPSGLWLTQLAIHFIAFFFTALICHQALAARRPPAGQLTEFYLLMSLGGVIGGAFNAFLAPVIFNGVWEYPLVMVLASFARPWKAEGDPAAWEEILFGLVAGCLVLGFVIHFAAPYVVSPTTQDQLASLSSGDRKLHLFGRELAYTYGGIGMAVAVVAAFLLRRRTLWFVVLVALITLGSYNFGPKAALMERKRSFFGVLKLTEYPIPGLGPVRLLAHGTTLHGAQPLSPAYACRPTTYYAPTTPIGQVFDKMRTLKGKIRVGAVGMGAGTVAAYTKPGDSLRFFEIDQNVIDLSTDPKNFSFIKGCAKGQISVKKGDARLSLRTEPKDAYDILLIDAFTSDAVPAHLLTVEAMKDYLSHLAPNGLVIMHLSNRHLDLMNPVTAVAKQAGGYALAQEYDERHDVPQFEDAAEEAVIVARTPEALAQYRADPRWFVRNDHGVRGWTDDYTNLFGAMWRRLTGEDNS